MQTARIIGGSYNADLALELSVKGRDVVQSDKYLKCFLNVRIRKDQNTKSHYKTTKGGDRYAVSIGGNVTGKHAHFIIIDDPLDPTKAISEAELKSANTWMTDTLPTRKVEKSVTPTILIMQRLHQNDCTANMIDTIERKQRLQGGTLELKHICIPAEVTDKVQPEGLKKYYTDGLMDPIRLPKKVLLEQQSQGEYSYAGQFLQWPVPLGGGMFKTAKIHVETDIPTKWLSKCRFWDKAGTEGGKGAFTVGLLMAKDRNNRWWILDVIRQRVGSFERETLIKHTAQVDGFNVTVGIEQEPGSGGKESAENTVRNLAGWNVIIDKPSGSGSSKELRADPFSVQVNAGNVYMKQADWNSDYISELTFFPYSKFKDQVDASSGAFNTQTRGKRKAGVLFKSKRRR
jgi:predicted phage terminase large subunit-like protein